MCGSHPREIMGIVRSPFLLTRSRGGTHCSPIDDRVIRKALPAIDYAAPPFSTYHGIECNEYRVDIFIFYLRTIPVSNKQRTIVPRCFSYFVIDEVSSTRQHGRDSLFVSKIHGNWIFLSFDYRTANIISMFSGWVFVSLKSK